MNDDEKYRLLEKQIRLVHRKIQRNPASKRDILVAWLDEAEASGLDEHFCLIFFNIASARDMADQPQVTINAEQLGNVNFGHQHSVVNTLHGSTNEQQKQVGAILAELLKSVETHPALSAPEKEEAAEMIGSLAEEAQSKKPKKGVVKAMFDRLPIILKSADGLSSMYEKGAPILHEFFLHHHF